MIGIFIIVVKAIWEKIPKKIENRHLINETNGTSLKKNSKSNAFSRIRLEKFHKETYIYKNYTYLSIQTFEK